MQSYISPIDGIKNDKSILVFMQVTYLSSHKYSIYLLLTRPPCSILARESKPHLWPKPVIVFIPVSAYVVQRYLKLPTVSTDWLLTMMFEDMPLTLEVINFVFFPAQVSIV